MSEDIKKQIAQAERLIRIGDYRRGRELVKKAAAENKEMSKEDAIKVERILAITGMDPFVIVGFLITAGLIVFLFMKYVF